MVQSLRLNHSNSSSSCRESSASADMEGVGRRAGSVDWERNEGDFEKGFFHKILPVSFHELALGLPEPMEQWPNSSILFA